MVDVNSSQIIQDFFILCVIPFLGILVKFISSALNKKAQELENTTNIAMIEKYLELVDNTVEKCVIASNQIYVEEFKNQGTFDTEAHNLVFNLTYDTIISILGEETINFLDTLFGNIRTYIKSRIEYEVSKQKGGVK